MVRRGQRRVLRRDKSLIQEEREELATRSSRCVGPLSLFYGTSFGCFRRTNLVRNVFPSRAALQPGALGRASGGTKALPPGGRGVKCWTHFSGRSTTDCLAKVRPSTVTWPHHETEEDRDAQDRAGRPSAVATRRPAETTCRSERPEDRAARRNELRRADRVSPEAPEHSLQREVWQRRPVRPRERQRQSRRRPIGLARRAHRPAR
jgi:hypothetical protein